MWPPKVWVNRKFGTEVSVLALVCLLSALSPSLSQANESTTTGDDRRDLLSYCYAMQVHELKLVQSLALETKRDLAGMKESTRREVENLNNKLISLNERRLGYMRGLLDKNDINPNNDLFRKKYDRLVLDDLLSNLRINREDRCRRECFIDTATSPNQPEQFDICAKKCLPITVTASLKRTRACQSFYVNLH